MGDMERYLEGVRVIDLTRLLPGPFATLLLADMGAEVIKVEDPGGGDYARYYPPMVGSSSAFFCSLNRNKRGVTLNLKQEQGRELLLNLLETADVLIESFRPGVMARLGLAPEVLNRDYPELIVCSITGYGQTGPMKTKAGHDLNFLAHSGLLDRNGRRGQPPHVPGFQVADIAGGALYAALGITSALFHRSRSGQGAHLDISMTEGALSLMIPTMARLSAGHTNARGAGMLSGGLPSYRVYPTADARYLAVAALEPKFWDPFAEAIGAPHLCGRGMTRGEDGEAIAEEVGQILASRSLQEWREVLDPLDVCVEPVMSLEEVLESELHKARGLFFEMQGVTQVRTPVTAERIEHRPAPDQGADNEEIYGALGLSGEELRELRAEGVI